MTKVTRIAYVKDLNVGKLSELTELAQALGKVRTEVWDRFGSINGVGVGHRDIRTQWVAEGRNFGVPARLWKETLRDVMDDIKLYREAAKVKVRKAIRRHTNDEQERKRLYTLLKADRWTEDDYLRRLMRKHCKHGHTSVDNQIILDNCCYTSFEHKGRVWLKVMGLTKGQRITIPLTIGHPLNSTLRLIIRNDLLEVHYAIDEPIHPRGCGQDTIGIDKGYTEAYVDSSGLHYGNDLGSVLSAESDYLKEKYCNRNKLRAVADAKPHKADTIKWHNLGRIKLINRKKKHTDKVKQTIYDATHALMDKAHTVVCEDLTTPIKSKKPMGKNQKRRLSAWVKGLMADALDDVSRRRGSAVHLVNAAYTSQVDCRNGTLTGDRRGDRFYCLDGVVLDADYNAARNVLARLTDPEIDRWTPHTEVKAILRARTERLRRVLDPSGLQLQPPGLSTESELPNHSKMLNEQLCLTF